MLTGAPNRSVSPAHRSGRRQSELIVGAGHRDQGAHHPQPVQAVKRILVGLDIHPVALRQSHPRVPGQARAVDQDVVTEERVDFGLDNRIGGQDHHPDSPATVPQPGEFLDVLRGAVSDLRALFDHGVKPTRPGRSDADTTEFAAARSDLANLLWCPRCQT